MVSVVMKVVWNLGRQEPQGCVDGRVAGAKQIHASWGAGADAAFDCLFLFIINTDGLYAFILLFADVHVSCVDLLNSWHRRIGVSRVPT
jgi:hypothetical protein